MNPSLFLSLVWKMQDVWKSHFALFTYYVGYLTPEILKAVLVLRRYGDEGEIRTLAEKESLSDADLNAALETAVGFSGHPVTYSDKIATVIPKLLSESLGCDLSEEAIPESEWKDILEYFDWRASRGRTATGKGIWKEPPDGFPPSG